MSEVKRVVVTGASSGIGEATARLFAARGWNVVGVARRADRLAALAASSDSIDTFVADVTSEADVAALAAYLAETGAVDALVNNAGGARGSDPVPSLSIDDLRWMLDVNVVGVALVTQALLPLLRAAAGASGSADIVTVSSTAGLQAYAGGAGYNAAKFAVHGLIGALRLDLRGEPIRVIEVAPGMVQTDEFSLNRLGGDAARAAAIYEGVDHPLVADDVASVIVSALEQPWHVNQDLIVLRPVAQAAQFAVHRGKLTPRL
ncbi:SDR family NAD(P)-dependent oxidoreductase [Gryllotalpicola protaetiae]|uniref:SDR family NAD(P)-dependent oxidoreductase n=1 Tax=Gryllotalpicola protaetiae TaxID=2419771 RepID=A0A387BTG7_9MICO|nr:SDR family NAD(P)-dependent oxidoreductase [Gryllotalpicola protaetiae]AYG04339.1 SDR family NAD(P)-dependent oxidoreductase [Gryllotalpicola protaetiae]